MSLLEAIRGRFGVPGRVWLGTGAYLCVYLSWQLWHWLPGSQQLVGDLFFWPITVAMVWAAWRAGERAAGAPRIRSAWRLVAAAMTAYLLGNVVQLVYEAGLGRKPYPSPADVMFLALYPLMFCALRRFPTPPGERGDGARRAFDLTITALGGLAVVWYVELGPVALSSSQALTLIVSIAYPVGDLILIAGIASLLLRGTVESSRDALRLMACGLTVYVTADLIYGSIVLHGTYHGGDPVDAVWMAAESILLLATFAQRPTATESLDSIAAAPRRASWLPYVAVALSLALLLFVQRNDVFYPDVSTVLIGLAIAVIVAVRQYTAERGQIRTRGELELIAELERIALEQPGWEQLTRGFMERVAAHLEVEHCALLAHEPDENRLRLIAAVGWPAGFTGRLTVPATPDTQTGHTMSSEDTVIVDDLRTDPRFPGAVALREYGIVSAMSARIRGRSKPYGALVVHTTRRRRFTHEEASFLKIVAGVLGAAAERNAAEEEIRHQAVHDGLTGLPNRVLFEDRLAHALTASRRHERRLAVLFIDLDSFKNINDSLGHGIGDEVLRITAMRLAGCLRPDDTLARMGGDEFAVVLSEIDEPQDASQAAERLLDALRHPLATSNGQQLVITASIGIAIGSHEQLATAEEMTRNADLAMYAAKRAGKGLVKFFASSMHESAVLRLELISDLRAALDAGQLVVHYQPIVALKDDAVVGAEALVRWNHPRLGAIAPADFIGLAEEVGVIGEIGRYVLGSACEELQRWRRLSGYREMFVTVNVSPLQLYSSRLLADVESALERTGVPPDRLILEITESVLCDRDNDVSRRLLALKKLGVRLAVDDFGTGYSALSYLQDMPVDILKIDKSFIDGLGASADNDQLVDGIIDLAHRVHLQTLAEGIETSEQAQTLSAMNSELGQGFHFAKPLAAEEFEALLQSREGLRTSVPSGVSGGRTST